MISMLNLGQLPLHLVYISLINKLSFNYMINPAILTEGMWWFTDLSAPDPIGLLPVLGGLVNMMNMQFSTTTNTSTVMRKMRRLIWILPVFMVPVWMTFPVVSSYSYPFANLKCCCRHLTFTGSHHRVYSWQFWCCSDSRPSRSSWASQNTCQGLS